MPNYITKNVFSIGEDNNYLIGGNIANAFAFGEIGSTTDFFLVGTEPNQESSYPMLTGNILDSDGKVLFRLVRNVLVINPGGCSRIVGDHLGYEIHDADDKLIFRVRTVKEKLDMLNEECFVTTISGNFYDKTGKLVIAAKSGEEGETIAAETKYAFGFNGEDFLFSMGLGRDELALFKYVVASGGLINELVTGQIENTTISLDGKLLKDVTITNCDVRVTTGHFAIIGNSTIANNQVGLAGPALNIVSFYRGRGGPRG